MIYEVALISIKPGTGTDFEEAVRQAAPHFKKAKGCRSFGLNRGIENPDAYQLVVGWDRVEDHMVTFRESEGFARWRELASPFFAEPPSVSHVHPAIMHDFG